VVKLNAAGSELSYATFLGGGMSDWGDDIAIDSSGAAYVTGETVSFDFPTTPGAFDTSYNGGYDDAFVVKLNASGTALNYATFLGGSESDLGTGIAIDSSGAVYVTGLTWSSNFPTTPGAFDTSYNGGYYDAFVVKLNATGFALSYTTFLGGSNYDGSDGIAIDSSGAAVVTGGTYSSDFPTTPGAFDPSYNDGLDAFVVKLGMGGGATTYSISGRIMDGNGNPIQGVTISAGAVGSVVTNASGYYTISGRPQDEYTLWPSKTGFRFEPETLNVTLSGNRTGQNFRGYNTACAAPLAEPFLRFPVDYGERDFSKIIQDTDEGGLINSWFDHLSPLYTANYSITLFTGKTYSKTRTSGPYFGNLYCYDHRCYDGHNGIDIVAPDKKHNPNPPVLAAAAGTIVRVVNSTTGYGKQVWIDHGNNYATLYGHLDRIDVSVGQHVDAGQQLGLMGSTGASGGTHLHFGVYFNYNLRDPWITTTVEARPEEVVDTFRWLGQQNDPWITPSVRLWQESVGKDEYLGQSGGILNTSNVTVTIPAGSVSTDTLFSLNEAPVAEASAQLRNTGLSFLLRILFGLGGSGGQSRSIAAAEMLSAPVTITVSYAGASLQHLDTAQLAPYYYEEATGSWTEIAATVNSSDKTVTFQTESTGDFSLQAPLLCPVESQEPDDHYMLAEALMVPGTASRLIDIADDEDWFLFDATSGQRYMLSTTSLANGVKPVIWLYDIDGVTMLASAEGWRSTLQWQAPADGKYFVRVTPAGDSTYGCEAAYTLNLSRLMQVYLPLVLRNR
jgi:murein DD-endopeptidase MepM/ murein hydrolase activator NlpD